MKNQRGEIVTGVMVAMMVVMMIVGGMHMMHGEHKHGEHRSEGDHAQTKHDQGTDKDMHQEPDKNEQAAGPSKGEDK